MHNKHGGSLRVEHWASPSKTLGVIQALRGLSPSGFPPGQVFNSGSYNKQTWDWRQWFFPIEMEMNFEFCLVVMWWIFPARPMEQLISNITSGWTVTVLPPLANSFLHSWIVIMCFFFRFFSSEVLIFYWIPHYLMNLIKSFDICSFYSCVQVMIIIII